ncbi:RrF2 family transcriptional regulator [Lachnoclostridium sp. An138]|uniref:RrF2 family transcriptional regulator n=1 Tax=Lachnoclostridium sp. An138 TaxID=1965560 RepID=UPI000B38A86E|nr:Rrf2 family transcriptional regulator [Lachnoclostridium sp. An138]OUQ13512.1 Rrf2 family transcriptional regulator [Lachnoclostridium sp. An138]
MLISTRGRYALRVLIDLAEYEEDGYTPLKDIAGRQDISQKYMESIMTMLSKNKLVEGVHGKGGGYRLNRSPEDYSVGEILRITEGTLAPVACLERDAQPCPRAADCRTLPLWDKLNDMITGYLDSVSLADLMKK